MKLRDRRVLRMLQEKGLHDAQVFHGPQKIWWTVVLIVLVLAGCAVPITAQWMGWYGVPCILLYLCIGFVVSGRYFNSIALTDKALVMINPNFLFKKISVFPLEQVRLVTMGTRRDALAMCCCIGECNYLEVGTDADLQLFYCAGIDEHDGYGEEGLTEKTLEDLFFTLKRMDVPVRSDFKP